MLRVRKEKKKDMRGDKKKDVRPEQRFRRKKCVDMFVCERERQRDRKKYARERTRVKERKEAGGRRDRRSADGGGKTAAVVKDSEGGHVKLGGRWRPQ